MISVRQNKIKDKNHLRQLFLLLIKLGENINLNNNNMHSLDAHKY